MGVRNVRTLYRAKPIVHTGRQTKPRSKNTVSNFRRSSFEVVSMCFYSMYLLAYIELVKWALLVACSSQVLGPVLVVNVPILSEEAIL